MVRDYNIVTFSGTVARGSIAIIGQEVLTGNIAREIGQIGLWPEDNGQGLMAGKFSRASGQRFWSKALSFM